MKFTGRHTGVATLYRSIALLGLSIALLSCSGGKVEVESRTDRLGGIDPAGQTVEFWYQYTDAREAALLDLIDLFNSSNPHGIEVQGKHVGTHADLYNRMLQGIHGGPLPELVVAYQNQAQIYHAADQVVDLTPYISSFKWGLSATELGDYFQAFIDQDNVDGVQTAFLPNRSMEMLYYNVDWLEELGYADPPQSWPQFEEMSRKAATQPFSCSTDSTRSLGIELSRDASRLAAMVFSRGGELLNADRSAYTYNSPAARASLTLIRDLVRDGVAALEENRDDGRVSFGEGQALFSMQSSSHVPLVTAAVDEGAAFEWGVAPVPYEGDQPIQNVYGASLAVCRSTAEKQLAAWLFVKWFTQPEQQDRWVRASHYFPVRRSIAHRLGTYYRAAYELLDYGKPEPAIGGYEPVRALAVDAMVEIAGGADMDAVLTRLDKEATATIQAFE